MLSEILETAIEISKETSYLNFKIELNKHNKSE